MNYQDPNNTPGAVAKHIPADVWNEMPRAEIVLPSAVVSAEMAAQQHRTVARMWTPDGREILVDVDAFAQHAATVAVQQKAPLPRWVISTALLLPVTAGSVALGAWGLSLAVPGLLAFAAAMKQLAMVLLGVAVLVGVVCLFNPKRTAGAGETVTATATVTTRTLLRKITATTTAKVRRH
ncbi:hypothetical protein [Streptomyces hydrogenans]|uniref:hypothetical protein n=1 Tax=Streptomyces hydrogenans TaxID=1873719 RepID=UPI003D70B55D